MAKRVLVVVDVQKDFIDGALGSEEAKRIVTNVLAKIKGWDGVVFATKDTHYQNYLHTQEGKKLAVPHCIRGTEGWDFPSDIQEALSEKEAKVIEKTTFGSVEELPESIYIKIQKELGEDVQIDWSEVEIQIIGLCTDICVVSNAMILKAYFPESPISVDAACCAGVTVETHEAALRTMEMCQIDIIR